MPVAVRVQAKPVERRAAGERAGRRRLGGLELVRAVGLTGLVRPASEQASGAIGAERLLPVPAELRDLLPGRGLRRGTTLAIATSIGGASAGDPSIVGALPGGALPGGAAPVGASPGRGVALAGQRTGSVGATSLLLLLLAAAAQAGSWCAVVGVPTLNGVAAAEAGIALDRLALIPHPGPDWATVVGALLDGLDIVVAAPPGPITPAVAARLAARARQRGSVLVSYGRWAGADLTLDAVGGDWHGLGVGRGRLQCRELTVVARGRGAAAVPRRARVWLPAASGIYAQLHPSPRAVVEPGTAEEGVATGRRALAAVGEAG